MKFTQAQIELQICILHTPIIISFLKNVYAYHNVMCIYPKWIANEMCLEADIFENQWNV